MPAINFANVKGLEPIPPDTYMATIVKAEAGVSNAGNEKVDLQWKIDGGDYDGRIVFDSLVFTENSLFRVKNTLLGLGFPKDFKGDIDPESLVGEAAEIVVDIQPGNGTDENGEPYPARNRVKKVKAV